jgi:prepilin-type N-terminal cleavage/methylation domain-containing protein
MNKAFTLVELAIVIVVIGIIASVVVGGQSIINSAKRSAVISEIKQMQTAVQAFKLEYDAYPGDMEEAYDYWGDDCGADSNNHRVGCNGNGDRCVGVNGTGGTNQCPGADSNFVNDQRRFFVHLALSKIMPDIAYTIDTISANPCKAGVDFPESGYSDHVTYTVNHRYKRNELVMTYYDTNGFSVGNIGCGMHGPGGNRAFHAREAEKIDKKIDDGRSNTGIVFENANVCSDTTTGDYKINLSQNTCNINIIIE